MAPMMNICKIIILSMVLINSAQAQVNQGGNVTPGHPARWTAPGVIGDGGGAGGSTTLGSGYLTELGITNTGTPICINDALISAPGGYHQLCLGANASGGGLISYNAYGGAQPLPFNCIINGRTFPNCLEGGGGGTGGNLFAETVWGGAFPTVWAAAQWHFVWEETNHPWTPAISGISLIGASGVVGAARTSDNPGLTDAVGIEGFALNDQTAVGSAAFGAYFEGDRVAGSNGPTVALELDIGNNGSTVDLTPFLMHQFGLNVNLYMGCGGAGFGGVGGTNPCSAAIGVVPNIRQFRKGIIIDANALDPTTDAIFGKGIAIELANTASLRWLNAGGGSYGQLWIDAAGLYIACNNFANGGAPTFPVPLAGTMTICNNVFNGLGEVAFFNNTQSSRGGFYFWQLNAGSGATLLATVLRTGDTTLGIVDGQLAANIVNANQYAFGTGASPTLGVSCVGITPSTVITQGGIITHC